MRLQRKDKFLNFQTLKTSVELVAKTDQSNVDTDEIYGEKFDHLETLCKLFSMLAGLQDVIDDQLNGDLYQIVTKKG